MVSIFSKAGASPLKTTCGAFNFLIFFFQKLAFHDSKTPIAISIFSKPVFYASKPPTVLPIFQFFSKAGALRLNTAYDSSHFFKSRPFAPPNRHRRFPFFQKPALRASKPPTTVSNFQSRRFAPKILLKLRRFPPQIRLRRFQFFKAGASRRNSS